MRHFGTRQRRSGSRQEASAFAAAALLLQVCSGRQAGGWSSGGKEPRREREVTIGVLARCSRPCCLLAYCRWLVMPLCEAEAAASKRGSELTRRRLRSVVLVARDVQPGLCALQPLRRILFKSGGATY